MLKGFGIEKSGLTTLVKKKVEEIIKQINEQCSNDEYVEKIYDVVKALLVKDDSNVLASFVRKMCKDDTAPDIDLMKLIIYKHGKRNLVTRAKDFETSTVSMSRWLTGKQSINSKQLEKILNT